VLRVYSAFSIVFLFLSLVVHQEGIALLFGAVAAGFLCADAVEHLAKEWRAGHANHHAFLSTDRIQRKLDRP